MERSWKIKIRVFYLPKDYIRMGILRDGKKLFTVVFSWSKMMLSWSKRMVSWRKVHWVFFLERRTKFEWEKKKLNGLSWRTPSFCWRTTSFCWRRKQMEKVFCHPEVHHPYIIMRQITSTDFIFQYSPLFPTPKALFISKPLFSIFCYPDQRHFFYLDFNWFPGTLW